MDEDHRRRGFAGFIHTDMMCSDIHQLARARRCCLTAAATRLVDLAEIQRALDLKVPPCRNGHVQVQLLRYLVARPGRYP